LSYGYIFDFLRQRLGDRNAIIGLSGGIDSSLVLALLSRSIPRERIRAVFMPDSTTPPGDYDDIRKLSEKFSIEVATRDITPVVNSFRGLLEARSNGPIGNIKSRARMTVLYYYANTMNGYVVGTTNYTEFITGYFTKYGDGGCDLEPIINLTKTEVRSAAREFGVPESIISKPPTAGLWEGQTDEKELGFTYDEIDQAIEYFRKHGEFRDDTVSARVKDLYIKSMHKRNLPYSPGEVQSQ
jgi:NAD+ synthase